MEKEFNSLVKQNLYRARKLYHGTTAADAESIEEDGINLFHCRTRTDFSGNKGFYVTGDIHQAAEWAKLRAKKECSTPAVVRFKIDRQELEELFNYKRFKVGEYSDWLNFTELSRSGRHYHNYEVVEGPYRVKAKNNKYTKPEGHQLGLFSEDIVKYFDNHIILMSNQLPLLLKGLSLG